jgi:hypothetical protein
MTPLALAALQKLELFYWYVHPAFVGDRAGA